MRFLRRAIIVPFESLWSIVKTLISVPSAIHPFRETEETFKVESRVFFQRSFFSSLPVAFFKLPSLQHYLSSNTLLLALSSHGTWPNGFGLREGRKLGHRFFSSLKGELDLILYMLPISSAKITIGIIRELMDAESPEGITHPENCSSEDRTQFRCIT